MKVGILGGGQLGMMLVEAGRPLGLEFLIFSEEKEVPCAKVAPLFLGRFDQETDLQEFLRSVDVVTYEWENLPEAAVNFLKRHADDVFPSPDTLRLAQDRLVQKDFFKGLQIPTAPYQAVDDFSQLKKCPLPGILKTRRWGYDGKGQWRIDSESSREALQELLDGGGFVYEGLVAFDRELSLVGSRDAHGQMVFFPLVENQHVDGILRTTWAPAEGVSFDLQNLAESFLTRAMEKLGYRGTATLELFQVGQGLLVNELASRVHNSGHWSIEGADTSQFESHLRAGLALGLKKPTVKEPTAMLNLISTAPTEKEILSVLPSAHVHLYGKSPKPGRKLGHITLTAPSILELKTQVAKLKSGILRDAAK